MIAFREGQVYRCPDESCGYEVSVTKGAPQQASARFRECAPRMGCRLPSREQVGLANPSSTNPLHGTRGDVARGLEDRLRPDRDLSHQLPSDAELI